jgi:hypothetical protein
MTATAILLSSGLTANTAAEFGSTDMVVATPLVPSGCRNMTLESPSR